MKCSIIELYCTTHRTYAVSVRVPIFILITYITYVYRIGTSSPDHAPHARLLLALAALPVAGCGEALARASKAQDTIIMTIAARECKQASLKLVTKLLLQASAAQLHAD